MLLMIPTLRRQKPKQMAIVGDAQRLLANLFLLADASDSGHALMLIIEASDNLSDFSWTTKQTSSKNNQGHERCQQIILANTFRLWPWLQEVSCHLLSVRFDIQLQPKAFSPFSSGGFRFFFLTFALTSGIGELDHQKIQNII